MNDTLQKALFPILALVLGAGGTHVGQRAGVAKEVDKQVEERIREEVTAEVLLERRLTDLENQVETNRVDTYQVRAKLGME